ncbi:MAG: biotin/lipoyl-containing protein [Candidatus Geothermarchaeales archaeon]
MKKKFRVRVGDRTFDVEVEEVQREPEEPTLLDREKTREERRYIAHPARAVVRTIEEAMVVREEGVVSAPLSGTVLSTSVSVGDKVRTGDLLLTLEAMKMENEIYSPVSGVVKEITEQGQDVDYGKTLVVIE